MRHYLTAAALAAGLVAPSAHAVDVWTSPYPGVRHLHRTTGPFDYHALLVDLRNPRVSFVATDERATLPRLVTESSAPADRKRRLLHRWTRTSSFANAVGAHIAINANYFDIFTRRHSACGLTVSGGKIWESTYQDRRLDCDHSIGLGDDGRAEIFDSRGMTAPPASWMREVVTGSPRLLRDGQLLDYRHPRHALYRNPRTAVGLSADRKTLLLMVVNGREGRAQGMTCRETARALLELGAADAVNLDGGGSSALFVRDEGGLVSRSADGSERPVGNHFGIVFREPPPPAVPVPLAPVATVAMVPQPAPALRPSRRLIFPSVPPNPARPSWWPVLALGSSLAMAGLLRLRRVIA